MCMRVCSPQQWGGGAGGAVGVGPNPPYMGPGGSDYHSNYGVSPSFLAL